MVKQGYEYKNGEKVGYYEFGNSRYYYDPGNSRERRVAKRQAENQQQAAYASGYEG